MESTEIDIKMWMSFGGRALGGAGKKKKKKREKQAQGDAHSSSQRECLSKQRFPMGRVPAEHWRSASASYIKYNESRMELMMVVLRTKRIRIMMAILRFPLTLPPWSELFYLQSCLL